MTYLYINDHKNTEKLMKYVPFSKFPRDTTCRVIFDGSTINFFTMNTLDFDISNKVLRIEKDKLFLISENLGKFTYDSEPIYDYLNDKSKSYKGFFKKLTVGEKDFESFVNMFERLFTEKFKFIATDNVLGNAIGVKFQEMLEKQDFEMITSIFVKSGNTHRLLKINALFADQVVEFISRSEKFYTGGDIPLDTRPEIISYFEKFDEKLLGKSSDEICKQIFKLSRGNARNHLINHVLKKIKSGDQINENYSLAIYSLDGELYREFLFLGLWRSSNFEFFMRVINTYKNEMPKILNILKDKLQFEMTNTEEFPKEYAYYKSME